MEGIRSYLFGVIAAAIVCGIVVKVMGDKGTQGAMAKLIAGLFLTFTMINPIARIRLDGSVDLIDQYSDDAMLAAAEGQRITREALRESIIAQSQAYILDKAADLHLELTVTVDVSVDDIPIPISVTLQGNISPFDKAKLSTDIAENLGIGKEDQRWK